MHTGVGPATDNNSSNRQLDNFFATYRTASLVMRDPVVARLPGSHMSDDDGADDADEAASARRYPEGGDPMDDSMVGTKRAKLAAPVAEVPMEKVCNALVAAADQHGLPVPFLARLIWQESRFRQSAVSPVGAQGVAQFMPRTANAYGLENPFDPLEALPVSARFLRELRDTFGNLGLAAAAYNGGAGRVQNWLAGRNRLPEETRNYVKIITGEPAEKWKVAANTVELAAHLPARAPCEGVAGLSREGEALSMPVVLAGWVTETIRKGEEAEAAARVAAAKARLVARAKGSKASRLAAKSKAKATVVAGKSKPGKGDKPNTKIAVVPEEMSAKKKSGAKSFKLAGASSKKAATNGAPKGAGKPMKLAETRRGR